jgi:hypothetical protein
MARELTDLALGYRYREGTDVYRTVHFVKAASIIGTSTRSELTGRRSQARLTTTTIRLI